MTASQRVAAAVLAVLAWLFFIGAANGAYVMWSKISGYKLIWTEKMK